MWFVCSVRLRVSLCACVYVFICGLECGMGVQVCLCVGVHERVGVHTSLCAWECVCMYICAYVCVNMRVYVRAFASAIVIVSV